MEVLCKKMGCINVTELQKVLKLQTSIIFAYKYYWKEMKFYIFPMKFYIFPMNFYI